MQRVILITVPLIVILFLMLLPVYPYLSEMRSISESGESLSQVINLGAMSDVYDAARFVRYAWKNSTMVWYCILFMVDHLILVGIYFGTYRILKRLWNK